jgi:exoribonuclease-2
MNRSELDRIARQAMLERGLAPDFAPAALAQAERLGEADADLRGDIRDLRALPWCSIDNDDSRDLDQLTAATEAPGGGATLWVAVADVDALVPPASPIDDHAAANTTSVYTAARVFPMLPERLSTDLSSLNPCQERPALVVQLVVSDDGRVDDARTELHRAVVFSQAQLAYDGVAAWLDGRAAAPPALASQPALQDTLRLQDRIAQALQRQRHARGALDLQTPEARPVFADGELVDLRTEERNRAKELIAELMIAANGAVARALQAAGFPALRRFLREPARWDRIVSLARAHGGALPPAPDALALDRFLQSRRAADPAGFADLSLAVVKLLGSGEYSAAPPGQRGNGHFGLAVTDYAHATAPNRRFPDLVTHRLLKAALRRDAPPYAFETLATLAAHCNRQETAANKVERQVRKAAAALLLAPRVGELFRGVVTGVKPGGTFVRTARPVVDGRIVQGFEGLDVGDPVRLRLLAVDAARAYIDFQALPAA